MYASPSWLATERPGEIGLLRALCARRQQVLMVFIGEAMMLSAAGCLAGLAIGIGVAQGLHGLFPALPVHTPLFFAVLVESSAVLIGLVAGVKPARPPRRTHGSGRGAAYRVN